MAGKQISTNDVALSFAREASFGESPAGGAIWRNIEPNEIGNYGGTTTTVARNPISPDRQQRKGVVTDFEAGVDITSDLTLDEVENWASGFTLNSGDGLDIRYTGSSATAGANGGYAAAGLATAGTGKIDTALWNLVGALVYAKGYATAANNGLKKVTAAHAAADAVLKVGGLTAETAPADARVSVVGYAADAGKLTVTAAGVGWAASGDAPAGGWEALGVKVGQWLYFGGDTANSIFGTASNNGWKKVSAIAINGLRLTVDGGSAVDDGNGKQIQVFFGRRWHNVPTNHTDFDEHYYRFEALYRELGAGNAPAYEYISGCAPNAWTIRFPLTEKATSQTVFIAKDAQPVTEARLQSASTRIAGMLNKAFNTSTDFARLRLVGETGDDITTFIKEVEMTITNNFAAEKMLNQQGAAFMNLGTLEVTGTIQVLFTDAEIVSSIRNNTTARIRTALTNEDGTVMFEIPSCTLGGGNKEFTLNETVKIGLDTSAFRDDVYGDSINVQSYHYLPVAAGGD